MAPRSAPPPPDPRALCADLTREIGARLGPLTETRALTDLLAAVRARADAMSPDAAPPLDAKALAALAADMGDDLDKLEDLLEALALAAGTG